MSERVNNAWLHRFAVLAAAATFVLLGAGGLVTSHGVGMAVPDWPNSYGYNMFFFPVSKWVGGIFYEHTHRLIASGVGMLTGILALWLFGRKARPFMRWLGLVLLVSGGASLVFYPKGWENGVVGAVTGLVLFAASFMWPRCEPAAKWLRWLGLIAFVAVVLQGVLGGMRVVLHDSQIGIFHAALAQLFFVLLCAIALFTSKWWQKAAGRRTLPRGVEEGVQAAPEKTGSASASLSSPSSLSSLTPSAAPARKGRPFPRRLLLGATALIFLQLVLGATMRHQHAGLAIPDFPLAYGKFWPATDAQSVARYNENRIEITAENPITAFQIDLQMAHRIVALLILLAVCWCAWRVWKSAPPETGSVRESWVSEKKALSRLASVWVGLILTQVGLGAWTILSNKAADIATAHVLVGALCLATGAMLCLISFRTPEYAPGAATVPRRVTDGHAGHPVGIQAATARS